MTALLRLANFTCTLALAAVPALALADGGSTDPDSAPLANPNTVRLGMYFVHYSATANDLSGPYTPAGINLSVQHVNTPYFSYLRDFTGHWQMELAAGIPPKTHTVGQGPTYLGSVPFNGEVVATARWFSPSILGIYKFLEPTDRFRPFLGAGINYTHFYDRDSTAAGDAANGGPTSTSLSDSWGPAATAGLYYRFTTHFSGIISFSEAVVKSNYSSDTAGIIRRTTVDFHPSTWVAALGYSF